MSINIVEQSSSIIGGQKKNKSYYDFGLMVEAEDKLFSISTCYMVGLDQRLSIHAVISAI